MAWKRTPVVRRHNRESVFTFGKYKGMAVKDVLNDDPGYLCWAAINIPELDLDVDIFDEAEHAVKYSRDYPLGPVSWDMLGD